MDSELVETIMNLSTTMLRLKASQEENIPPASVSDREYIILKQLKEKGQLSISDIADAAKSVSYSTISTDVTKLWREKKMVEKNIDPDNQRVTLVKINDAGLEVVSTVEQQRGKRINILETALNVNEHERQILIDVVTRAIEYLNKTLENTSKENN